MTLQRTYLDYNSTTPLSSQARSAMLEAMNAVGNASSVHWEGRWAKGVIETAREQISESLDAPGSRLIFTSGATESAAILLKDRGICCSRVEHPCVSFWCETNLQATENGEVRVTEPSKSTVQLANSETGIIQELPENLYMSDVVQGVGKIDFSFQNCGAKAVIISAHKLGGPAGVGAVLLDSSTEVFPLLGGGGQESGYRSGSENIIAIAGFGAAVEFEIKKLNEGVWERVRELRDYLENELNYISEDTIFVGRNTFRLPNTSCIVTPNWKGETQVMQMDLRGFAISSGSACSSGKVTSGETLRSLGFEAGLVDCAIRVSLGSETKKEDIEAFLKEWQKAYKSNKGNIRKQ